MKILLPVDGSDYSKFAVKYLLSHKSVFGEQVSLTLAHVYPSLPGHISAHIDKETLAAYHAEQVESATASARKLLDAAKQDYKITSKRGDAGEEIAKLAEKGKFDMVIMGSHGRGAFSGLFLGSVARKVLAACKVPVLLIRE
ncbi:universal stress protein [Parvibium lacunae]|uniref:Universal stress protein n=1 Tax=Parvibium lacunae TaxID=1888893 RepID=A0A368L3Z6_9BURK|nr:universal stress protein [Parvibium lacunae]RCS58287.1 universal stress protein [Parvibium lacunae]